MFVSAGGWLTRNILFPYAYLLFSEPVRIGQIFVLSECHPTFFAQSSDKRYGDIIMQHTYEWLRHSKLWGTLEVILLALLTTAAKCPFEDTDQKQDAEQTSNASAVDVGETTGSTWTISVRSSMTVTIRNDTDVLSQTINDTRSLVSLGGRVINAGDFCWRVDVACPQQIFSEQIQLAQSATELLLVGFDNQGPFSSLPTGTGLRGQINGNEIQFELPSGLGTDPCTIQANSAIIATAYADEPTEESTVDAATEDAATKQSETDAGSVDSATQTAFSQTIQGRITIVYSGNCVILGGTGEVDPEDTVELSATFTATRQ